MLVFLFEPILSFIQAFEDDLLQMLGCFRNTQYLYHKLFERSLFSDTLDANLNKLEIVGL
jgi:hypothetical protein